MKVCRKCSRFVPYHECTTERSWVDRLRILCLECNRSRNSRWIAKNKERKRQLSRKWTRANPEKDVRSKRDSWLRCTYDLTEKEWETMLAEQEGDCIICGSYMDKPFVDHCHSIGKVRGLLCSGCNTIVGFYEKIKNGSGLEQIVAGYLAGVTPLRPRFCITTMGEPK